MVVAGVYFLPDAFVGIGCTVLYVVALFRAFHSSIGLFEVILFVCAAIYFLVWIIGALANLNKK